MGGLIKNLLAKLTSQKGFTILESVLTTSVLSIGLMGGVMVMQNTVLASAQGDRTSIAIQLAQEKAEEIMADKKFKGYAFASDASNYPSENFDGNSGYKGFVRTVTVTEVDPIDLTTPTLGSGMSKVAVSVSWGSSTTQHVAYNTLMADYE